MSREPIPAAAVASVAEMEITLVIEAAEHDPPAAGNERRLLAVIGSGLERLGVQPKHWREP